MYFEALKKFEVGCPEVVDNLVEIVEGLFDEVNLLLVVFIEDLTVYYWTIQVVQSDQILAHP